MSLIEATEPSDAVEQTAVLEARDVTVRFGGLVALSEVSISVPRGNDRRPRGAERRGQDDTVPRRVRAAPTAARRSVPRRRSASRTARPASARGLGLAAHLPTTRVVHGADRARARGAGLPGPERTQPPLERSRHRRRAAPRVTGGEGASRLSRRSARTLERRQDARGLASTGNRAPGRGCTGARHRPIGRAARRAVVGSGRARDHAARGRRCAASSRKRRSRCSSSNTTSPWCSACRASCRCSTSASASRKERPTRSAPTPRCAPRTWATTKPGRTQGDPDMSERGEPVFGSDGREDRAARRERRERA